MFPVHSLQQMVESAGGTGGALNPYAATICPCPINAPSLSQADIAGPVQASVAIDKSICADLFVAVKPVLPGHVPGHLTSVVGPPCGNIPSLLVICRSIANKFELLGMLMTSRVILLTETSLDGCITNENFGLPDFQIFRSDRVRNSGGGEALPF